MAEPPGVGRDNGPFPFAQLEFGFRLGPGDGRYLLRRRPEAPPEGILVVSTTSGERTPLAVGRRRGRRRTVGSAEVLPTPVTRITLVEVEPFPGPGDAQVWLDDLRRDSGALVEKTNRALAELNRMLRAQRAVTGDPYVREVSAHHALARRVGYGAGPELAESRFDAAVELPAAVPSRRRRPERSGPQERLAAVLGRHAEILVCEELVLRARLDLEEQRPREAALQARIALEAMLSELRGEIAYAPALDDIRGRRDALAGAANAALDGELGEEKRSTVAAVVEEMDSVLARRRAE